MARARFAEILHLLSAGEVEYVVVGMTAGILQGWATLEAEYRHDARRLRPQASHLLGPGHQLLSTTHGDLDCLGTIADGLGSEDLAERTVSPELSDGLTVRVPSHPALIEAKERAGRPKDLAALPVLRATLDEINRRS